MQALVRGEVSAGARPLEGGGRPGAHCAAPLEYYVTWFNMISNIRVVGKGKLLQYASLGAW